MDSLITIDQLSHPQITQLLSLAEDIREQPQAFADSLSGQHIAMLFEKPSLRTRASFQVGIEKMGGYAHFYDMQHDKLGVRESVPDLAKNLQQWYQGVIARVDRHEVLTTLNQHLDVPLINALCEAHHPCQALADFLTLYQIDKNLAGWHIVYIGDSNNVSLSLMQLAVLVDARVTLVTPPAGQPNEQEIALIDQFPGRLKWTTDVNEVDAADVVYSDVWVSMGATEDQKRLEEFSAYQVDDTLMQQWKAKFFMHCQPVHRGQEVTSSVCDANNSLIYQQAANRQYAQQALLHMIFNGDNE